MFPNFGSRRRAVMRHVNPGAISMVPQGQGAVPGSNPLLMQGAPDPTQGIAPHALPPVAGAPASPEGLSNEQVLQSQVVLMQSSPDVAVRFQAIDNIRDMLRNQYAPQTPTNDPLATLKQQVAGNDLYQAYADQVFFSTTPEEIAGVAAELVNFLLTTVPGTPEMLKQIRDTQGAQIAAATGQTPVSPPVNPLANLLAAVPQAPQAPLQQTASPQAGTLDWAHGGSEPDIFGNLLGTAVPQAPLQQTAPPAPVQTPVDQNAINQLMVAELSASREREAQLAQILQQMRPLSAQPDGVPAPLMQANQGNPDNFWAGSGLDNLARSFRAGRG